MILLMVLALLFLGDARENASAENKTEEEVQEELDAEIEKYLNSLDLGEFESFLASVDMPEEMDGSSIKDLLERFLDGEVPVSPKGFFAYLGDQALGALSGTLASLLTVVIIAVMSSILSGLTSGFKKKQTIDIVHFVFYALVVTIVMVKIAAIVAECRKYCLSVTRFCESIFPPLITLMSALGGSASTSIYKPQIAIFSVVISKILGNVILPLFVASIAFCLIGNLSTSIKMDKIQSAIRYASTLIVSCVFGLFMTYLTIAGITGGMVDGVGIKAAKFVLSGYVPILGGYLSQGFDLISAGCVLIKNSIGMIGILSVLFMMMKPILHITIFSFSLKVVSSVIQPLGDKRISDFLYSVSNATKILVTAVLGTGFVLILTLILMVVTCNVGVL